MSRTAASSPATTARERPPWRAVAMPTEHGGWGLTLEPVLLGLAVSFSGAGLAIGVAAFAAFLVRTPLKLALVDRRRHRSLPRTRLAERIAASELGLIVLLALIALWSAGAGWLVPVVFAVPLVGVELWYDVRSRGRRLVPELAGAIGIGAVVAAIAIASGEGRRLALALWMVLAARAVGSIPYVRAQIVRMRRGRAPLGATDLLQLVSVAVAFAAVTVDPRVLVGAVGVTVVAAAQSIAVRRERIAPVKIIGLRQMAAGLAVVALTAAGVLV